MAQSAERQKGAPAWKKYTAAVSGGSDKYELCPLDFPAVHPLLDSTTILKLHINNSSGSNIFMRSHLYIQAPYSYVLRPPFN